MGFPSVLTWQEESISAQSRKEQRLLDDSQTRREAGRSMSCSVSELLRYGTFS